MKIKTDYRNPLRMRNLALRVILRSTDVSPEELRETRANDINLEKGTLQLRGKRKNKIIALNKKTWEIVKEYMLYGRWELVLKQRHKFFFAGQAGGRMTIEEMEGETR